MTEDQILDELKLPADELEDLFRKLNRFAEGLNARQRAVFEHSLKTAKEAAQELPDLSAEQLESTFRKYAPAHGILCFACRLGKRPPKPGE